MHSAYYADDGRARLALPLGRCLLPSCSYTATNRKRCIGCLVQLMLQLLSRTVWDSCVMENLESISHSWHDLHEKFVTDATRDESMLLVSKTTTSSSIFSQSASWNALSFTLLERVLISSATHILSDQVSPSWDSLTDRTPSTDFGKYLFSFLTLYWFVHHLNNRFCDRILHQKMA